VPLVVDDVLSCAASAAPGRLAVTLGEDRLTFGDLRRRANRLANALLGLRVGPGDRVAWWSETSLDGVGLYFGLGRIGAPFVPLNPGYSHDEARAVLEYLAPRLLVVDPAHAERAAALAADLGVPLASVGAGDVRPGHDLDRLALAASSDTPPVPLPKEDDVFTVFLTSGSTGRPKGVMVSQRATWLRTHAGAAAHVTCGGTGDVVMFPLFHMAGWNFSAMAWSSGRPAHLVRRADPDELLGAVERWSAATLYCLPAVWQRVLASDTAADTTSLEWALTGTSQVTTELLSALKARFPTVRTTVNYGSTETGRAVALSDRDLFDRPGSVGLPIPGVRACVADDGELLLRTDRVMSGYWDLPAETAEVLRGGWYHTGDLATRDDDGYLTIVGRKKEVIRTGGETVAPVEVEAALTGYPGVVEVAVVGLPDPDWGEVVCAVVVLADGAAAPTAEALAGHLTGRLARHKHPRRVVVADGLPRTPATGQVQRAVLARRFGG
jgi:acyl-CoA synthetase (AMP-forming)/AMP-acid ligase II